MLVDDFVGMGGALANLKGYIESKGGKVLAAVCLTGKPHSAKLALSAERLQELRSKHGTEARYLARTETVDTIRDRIAAAKQS